MNGFLKKYEDYFSSIQRFYADTIVECNIDDLTELVRKYYRSCVLEKQEKKIKK